MVKLKDSILKDYQNSVEIQDTLITLLKKKLNTIAYTRLGLFLIEVIFVSLIISFGYHWIYSLLIPLPVICFLFLLKKQTSVQEELNYAIKLLFIFVNEVKLITLGENKYNNGQSFMDELHPYSSDLDIFGPSSLYALINRSNTVKGMELIAVSLSKPKQGAEILDRQEAIAEMKAHITATFHFRAGLQNHHPKQLALVEQKLTGALPEQLKFIRNRVLQFYTNFSPVLSIGLLVTAIFLGGLWWQGLALLLLFNAGLSFFYAKYINVVHAGFGGSSILLNAISGTIKWTESVSWKSKYINSFYSRTPSNQPLSTQIKQLSAIIQSFDVRLNILLGTLFNVFLLWDLRCTIKLANWFDQSAAQLVNGLLIISQFEEIISLATLHYNEPEWTFPEISSQYHLEALAMGHPLIHEKKRVINSYHFAAAPTVDIVTGSNMAGKSTFLRTTGINMVLAFAGGPVCATRMKVSIFELLTYMRIKDSLNDQTSTFKAELNRLKMILEGVSALQNPLVLIDEMLRGTNSKDKYLGSKVFIEKMISERTPALFATHDLQLSEMIENYPEEIRNYHFDIQLSAGEMNFDYKLKAGACKTFNAALLLKEIGLSFNPDANDLKALY